MTRTYDLVVLGTGTAANGVATRVRAANRSVAVIDFRPFGGTCALRGCDPKKMLVGGAAAFDHARRMHGKGIAGDIRIDWPELMTFKRGFTDPVPAANEHRYAAKGIDAFHGRARFTGRNTLAIDGETLQAAQVLIAAGAEPVRLGIEGEEHLVSNEEFLSLPEIPRRIVLVGGGYIAAEFSHIAARAGATVTILQRGERMLKNFEPELVGWSMKAFDALGIDVRTATTVRSIEKLGRSYCVHAASGGQSVSVDADLVVHAGGRAPALDSLDLRAAGIESERGRLKLNAFLQSVSNPAVYAAGDAAQAGPPLTPVAGHDAEVVAANLLEGNHRKPDYTAVPSVVFTIPPLASVGFSEAQARRQGLHFRMKCEQVADWFTARQAAEATYGFKVLVEEPTGRILGAHLVGPHADEVINIFALAIRHALTAEDLKATMFSYPSATSDVGYML